MTVYFFYNCLIFVLPTLTFDFVLLLWFSSLGFLMDSIIWTFFRRGLLSVDSVVSVAPPGGGLLLLLLPWGMNREEAAAAAEAPPNRSSSSIAIGVGGAA